MMLEDGKSFCFNVDCIRKHCPDLYVENLARIVECMYDHNIVIGEVPIELEEYKGDHRVWDISWDFTTYESQFLYFGVTVYGDTEISDYERVYNHSDPGSVFVYTGCITEEILEHIKNNFEGSMG